jgi:hypothetical protein
MRWVVGGVTYSTRQPTPHLDRLIQKKAATYGVNQRKKKRKKKMRRKEKKKKEKEKRNCFRPCSGFETITSQGKSY